MERFIIQLTDEGQQQVIEAPQPDRHAGDGGHVVVENAQGIKGLVEVTRRRKLQPGRALSKKPLVIRQHVARLVGSVPLEHVAQHPLCHGILHGGRQLGVRQRVFGGERQGPTLLGR